MIFSLDNISPLSNILLAYLANNDLKKTTPTKSAKGQI